MVSADFFPGMQGSISKIAARPSQRLSLATLHALHVLFLICCWIAAAQSAAVAASKPEAQLRAGYETIGRKVTTASAELKVPEVNCHAERSGALIGIFALRLQAVLYVYCDAGLAGYFLLVQAGDDTQTSSGVFANDRIRFAIRQSKGTVSAEIFNKSGAFSLSASGSTEPVNSLLFGALPLRDDEAGNYVAVPDFRAATITKAKFNGRNLTADDAKKLHRVEDGTVTLKTGKLEKGSFKLTPRVD